MFFSLSKCTSYDSFNVKCFVCISSCELYLLFLMLFFNVWFKRQDTYTFVMNTRTQFSTYATRQRIVIRLVLVMFALTWPTNLSILRYGRVLLWLLCDIKYVVMLLGTASSTVILVTTFLIDFVCKFEVTLYTIFVHCKFLKLWLLLVRPTITSLVLPCDDSKQYCLVTEARVCEQFASTC